MPKLGIEIEGLIEGGIKQQKILIAHRRGAGTFAGIQKFREDQLVRGLYTSWERREILKVGLGEFWNQKILRREKKRGESLIIYTTKKDHRRKGRRVVKSKLIEKKVVHRDDALIESILRVKSFSYQKIIKRKVWTQYHKSEEEGTVKKIEKEREREGNVTRNINTFKCGTLKEGEYIQNIYTKEESLTRGS